MAKVKTLPTTYYVDGIAQRVRDSINFEKFAVQVTELTKEEINLLLTLPQVDSGCLVRTNPNKSGSAFSQMKEHAIIAGFMRGSTGTIRALVVYTERPDDDSYEYGFVDLSQIKHARSTAK